MQRFPLGDGFRCAIIKQSTLHLQSVQGHHGGSSHHFHRARCCFMLRVWCVPLRKPVFWKVNKSVRQQSASWPPVDVAAARENWCLPFKSGSFFLCDQRAVFRIACMESVCILVVETMFLARPVAKENTFKSAWQWGSAWEGISNICKCLSAFHKVHSFFREDMVFHMHATLIVPRELDLHVTSLHLKCGCAYCVPCIN